MLLIEIVPRTGLNLLRYKRRLRRMASEVCPPDKSWQVILLLVGAVAFSARPSCCGGTGWCDAPGTPKPSRRTQTAPVHGAQRRANDHKGVLSL